jgi:hypothetical protein
MGSLNPADDLRRRRHCSRLPIRSRPCFTRRGNLSSPQPGESACRGGHRTFRHEMPRRASCPWTQGRWAPRGCCQLMKSGWAPSLWPGWNWGTDHGNRWAVRQRARISTSTVSASTTAALSTTIMRRAGESTGPHARPGRPRRCRPTIRSHVRRAARLAGGPRRPSVAPPLDRPTQGGRRLETGPERRPAP